MTQQTIDNVAVHTTPKAMMQAIDANFTELYSDAPKVWGYVSTPAVTTITVAGTYYPVAGTFTNAVNQFSAATVVTPGIKYDGADTQDFEIDIHAEVTANFANTDVTIAVYKNGALISGSAITTECRAAASPYSLSSTVVVSLATNDEIQLVTTSDGSGDQLTFVNFQATIHPF